MRTVIYQCLICYRFKAQATEQLMVELPSKRVQSSWPFLTTGVDYAGQMTLRLEPTLRKAVKRLHCYICLLRD